MSILSSKIINNSDRIAFQPKAVLFKIFFMFWMAKKAIFNKALSERSAAAGKSRFCFGHFTNISMIGFYGIFLPKWFFVNFGEKLPLTCNYHSLSEKFKTCTTIHLSLNIFEPVDLAFDWSLTPI
jgi:hypothetical protein